MCHSCLSLPFSYKFASVSSFCILFFFISDPMKCIILELSEFGFSSITDLFPGVFLLLVWLLCTKESLHCIFLFWYGFILFFLMLAASHRFEYILKAWLHGSLLAVISVLIFVLFFLHESSSVIHLKSPYLCCCFSFGDPFPGRPSLILFNLLLS